MTAELVALLSGAPMGRVTRDARGRLTFRYDDQWRSGQSPRIPLSLSLPVLVREHAHKPVAAFLWNLLPDNERVLERWAARFHVSARNPFALIAQVGEDCAGAVQFVRPQRLDAILADTLPEVEWLDDGAVEERLRALRADPSRGRSSADAGQFSLAGAQPKTALLCQDGRWGIPAGRTPTTHILKPPTGEFDGHPENEHFCLSLARRLGLPAATSTVRRFGAEVAIVVERYDRVGTAAMAAASAARSAALATEAVDDPAAAGWSAQAAAQAAFLRTLSTTQPILRLHQEDLCQALGLMPTVKYQNEGGPSPGAVMDLLRAHSSNPEEDTRTFLNALILNWIIGGTDAHAKNYSLLHGSGGQVRLAPLYDLASALPYGGLDPQRMRLAMAVGGEYRMRDVGRRQWLKLAHDVRLDGPRVLDRARELIQAVATEAPALCGELRQQGLHHPILPRLVAALSDRATVCQRLLGAEP